MANFLNTDGLSALWAKIKSKFYTKTEVDALIPEDEVMVVNISWDDVNQKYVADKTAQEIAEFVNSGGVAVVNSNDSNSMLLCNTVVSDVTENYYYTGFYYAAIEDVEGGTLAYGGRIAIKHENGIESVDIAQGNNSIPLPAGNSDGVPIMDGTASRGDSNNYARADHVHPSDTSKANTSDVLTKTNTTSYTPTADYNPATKKYVDDSIPVVSPINSVQNGSILLNNNSSSLSPKINMALKFRDGSLIIGANDWDDEGDDVSGYLTIIGGGTHGHMTNLKPTYTGGTSIDINLPASAGTLALTSDILSNLSELSDTAISSPSNGQVLSYDSASSKWINTTLSSDTFIVTITSGTSEGTTWYQKNKSFNEIATAYDAGKKCYLTHGIYLYYLTLKNNNKVVFSQVHQDDVTGNVVKSFTIDSNNDIAYKATHIYENISELNDVTILSNSLTAGQALIYRGANIGWRNTDIATDLVNLTDTTITSPANGQILSYDSTTSKWINTTLDTGTIYSLSMTNNVITLTGSDSSTSSVTLPVYNGGVSS